MIKGVDKWLVVVLCDRKDYIKEVEMQVGDKEILKKSLIIQDLFFTT